MFKHFAREIILSIIAKLNVFSFYNTLPLVCKDCHKLFLENFHDYHHREQYDKSHTRSPTKFLKEIWRFIGQSCRSFKIEPENTKRIFPPRRIFEWPDGTSIPEIVCVLIFTDKSDGKSDCNKIYSMIILPNAYPKSCRLQGALPNSKQNLLGLKRLVL